MYNDGHTIMFTLERAYATTSTTNNEKDNSPDQSNRPVPTNTHLNTMNMDKQQQVANSDKSTVLVGQLANQPSVNEYSLKGPDKDLLSVLSMASADAVSSSDIPAAVSPTTSTKDYESIEDKSDFEQNGKQIDDNISADTSSNALDNNEHTTIVEFRGAGLAYAYRFFMLLIRFGSENSRGSEHQIASQSLPAEVSHTLYLHYVLLLLHALAMH